MIRQNEVEEIILLINKGFDLQLLSFELDIPIEQVQVYKEQLQLRRFAKESIKSKKTQAAIKQLNDFIDNTDYNIVERMILLKLQAYVNRIKVNEEDLKKIEEERKVLGFSRSIDEILDELKVQIPRRKNSNLRKREKQYTSEKQSTEETFQELEETAKTDYEEVIKKYKEEIVKNPQNSLNRRNVLAFAYFKAGRIDEARDELLSLIEQFSNYTAYRQLVYLERYNRNFDDAKLWAYDCLERFPNDINIREQLISIAIKEDDDQEIIKQLKEIIRINPDNKKSNKMLETIKNREER